MQNSSASSEQISNNGNHHQSGNMYCSTSTLSDTGSWDTDFDDDQNSESSGFYGDVGPTMGDKASVELATKNPGQGRVAALAKTVAASLAASGHSGSAKFQKTAKKRDILSYNVNSTDVGSKLTARPPDRPPLKPLPKPLLSCQGMTSVLSSAPGQQSSSSNDSRFYSKDKNTFVSSNSVNKCNSTSITNNVGSLPKPPGPGSEQIQQVIGALGHLWSSDSMSLSSQTQSDDDYEPMQSDSSPQMARLSPHSLLNRSPDENSSSHSQRSDSSSSIPDSHLNSAVPAPSFLHSSPRGGRDQSGNTYTNSGYPKTSMQSAVQTTQSTPFLHSSAAAAALAAVAASAAACRLSQSSKRSSGSDSFYTPSSGSSTSEVSHNSVLQSADGVYEPIEEKLKVESHSSKSFLHSTKSSEKSDVKRAASSTKNSLQDQRPPVPNRPLPPTPRPSEEKPSFENSRGGPITANLDHHPWFHNVDRKQAEELIKNGVDGYFLIRPSSQSQNPLTLTLWYNQRVYNISVRQRKDGRIALGFEKPDEQSFSSIEEMVLNYQSENLLLFSRNERTGRTVLTKSPPKERH